MKGILCSIGFVLCGLSAVAQVGSKEVIGSGAGELRGIQEFLASTHILTHNTAIHNGVDWAR